MNKRKFHFQSTAAINFNKIISVHPTICKNKYTFTIIMHLQYKHSEPLCATW